MLPDRNLDMEGAGADRRVSVEAAISSLGALAVAQPQLSDCDPSPQELLGNAEGLRAISVPEENPLSVPAGNECDETYQVRYSGCRQFFTLK